MRKVALNEFPVPSDPPRLPLLDEAEEVLAFDRAGVGGGVFGEGEADGLECLERIGEALREASKTLLRGVQRENQSWIMEISWKLRCQNGGIRGSCHSISASFARSPCWPRSPWSFRARREI